MLLLLFSGGGGRTEKKTAPPDLTASQEATERQLTALLKTVAGVGRVKVAVTVDRLQANVYAVNTEQTSEPDRAQRSEKYVFTETGRDSIRSCPFPSRVTAVDKAGFRSATNPT